MATDGARLLEANLPDIQRITAQVCRRHGLLGDDADDFRSWALSRLVDADYAILRRFRGESSMTTYLVVVLNNLFRDFRNMRKGKWRTSAMARRLGSVAVALEKLVVRDGRSLAEAAGELRSRGMDGISERRLGELAALLPHRTPTRPVSAPPGVVAAVPSADRPDGALDRREAEERREAVMAGLEGALHGLPAEDRLLVRLRFLEGFTVAAVARTLGLEQKPLYRRYERVLSTLRQDLEARGIDERGVAALLEDPPPLDPGEDSEPAAGFHGMVSVKTRGPR